MKMNESIGIEEIVQRNVKHPSWHKRKIDTHLIPKRTNERTTTKKGHRTGSCHNGRIRRITNGTIQKRKKEESKQMATMKWIQKKNVENSHCVCEHETRKNNIQKNILNRMFHLKLGPFRFFYFMVLLF